MSKTLLLGSSSKSRQLLLKEAHIPFEVIGHSADELSVDHSLPPAQLVLEIARLKMNHSQIPSTITDTTAFVLTADSLGVDPDGTISGKPKDKADAHKKLLAINNKKSICVVGVCITKQHYDKTQQQWIEDARIEFSNSSEYIFYVPENWIEQYLTHSWAMIASSAVAIELYGGQFLKEIKGSYSAIVGLPLFEVRQALDDLGFFN